MTLKELNEIPREEFLAKMMTCCTSTNWGQLMEASRPFSDQKQLKDKALAHWQTLTKNDFLEAFDGHPKIGDVTSLKMKYANTKDLASNEQSGVNHASDTIIEELAVYNQTYERRYGFIFIVCATGKSAEEMLAILKERINNEPNDELQIAAREQAKITNIRLEKLLCHP